MVVRRAMTVGAPVWQWWKSVYYYTLHSIIIHTIHCMYYYTLYYIYLSYVVYHCIYLLCVV